MEHSIAKTIYRWTAFAAIPGVLWSGFEMYVLTLRGAQMLFFSIVHTMPPLVIAVLVGILGLILLILQSVVALFSPIYHAKIAVDASILVTLTVLALFHLTLLFTYEIWSYSSVRVGVCLIGLITLCWFVWLALNNLSKPRQSHTGA